MWHCVREFCIAPAPLRHTVHLYTKERTWHGPSDVAAGCTRQRAGPGPGCAPADVLPDQHRNNHRPLPGVSPGRPARSQPRLPQATAPCGLCIAASPARPMPATIFSFSSSSDDGTSALSATGNGALKSDSVFPTALSGPVPAAPGAAFSVPPRRQQSIGVTAARLARPLPAGAAHATQPCLRPPVRESVLRGRDRHRHAFSLHPRFVCSQHTRRPAPALLKAQDFS